MKVNNGLFVPIYEFQSDINLVNEVIADLKQKPFTEHISQNNTSGYFANYFHPKLFDFFEQSIAEVQKIYYKENISFPIVDCWANKYTASQSLALHTHSNGFISGVYYLNSLQTCSTCFTMPNPWSHEDPYKTLTIYKNEDKIIYEVFPTEGTLLLFPSQLKHYININKDMKKVKYSISFNAFPSGNLCDIAASTLSLHAISVREKIDWAKSNK